MAIKVYVDQGHNPKSPNSGAEGNGYREQDISYAVGVELYNLLIRNPNYTARLSRPTPQSSVGTSNSSSLSLRVSDANNWGADVFVSIHTNASSAESASGSEALVYSEQTPAYRIGEDILTALNRQTGLRNRGVKIRPGLYVLRRTKMPAVIVELGFITNLSDAELMVNRPDLFARGIYDGLNRYYGFQTSSV